MLASHASSDDVSPVSGSVSGPDLPKMPRRRFLTTAGSALVLGGAGGSRVLSAPVVEESGLRGTAPLVISTWPFGKPANERALEVLTEGRSGLDAVEEGVRLTESDPNNSSVGLAGIPNAEGKVELDACIMSGPGHRAGSVAAVSGFRHPISIARRVMETTPHVMLVGAGAMAFARQHGFETGPEVSDRQREAWKKWRERQVSRDEDNHDTIALLLLLPNGDLFGGCSTSGWGYKLAGRVGDSPIIGGGLYVDNEVGAAGATGLGENVMRYCGSFLVVEFMRQGLHPQDACLETIRRIARLDPRGFDLAINFIAVDKKGRFGAAGTGQGFEYAVATPQFSRVQKSPGLTDNDVGPLGGNRR
jgi:N4-(beta-N-acetylglucosaminyl)-L-asparaginase